jgi:hypothetical protein
MSEPAEKDEERTTITLELLLAGDGVSGRALSADGDVREFSGRLGLMHTIDELLAGAGTTTGRPPGRPIQGRETR